MGLFCFYLCLCPGRITNWKAGTTNHSVSISCYLHKKCSKVKLVRLMPFGTENLCIQYLLAGLQIADRDDAKKHTDMLPDCF